MNKVNNLKRIDPKLLGKILVIMGGKTSEREVSINSGTAAYESLKKKGCDVELLDWKDNNSLLTLTNLAANKKIDRVFIALHGMYGEDGCIQGLLECFGIPYTGSGLLASSLCMDKVYAKAILRSFDMPVLDDIYLNTENKDDVSISEIENKLGYPLCVKPVFEGSSVGVKRVVNQSELRCAINELLIEYKDIMIEPWVDGREITVGFLDGKTLPVLEIKVPNKENAQFYDYNAKYISNDTKYVFPEDIESTLKEYILDLASKTFTLLKGDCWGRVDMILDEKSNKVFILELNTIPGLTSHSLVPMGAKKIGVNFDELILKIISKASLKNKENQLNTGKIKVN